MAREDLRRLRAYLEELENYVDAVAGSGGFTQAQANALYLKRGAADFTTFASKTTPTGSDILLLEDAAAGDAKKQALVSAVVTAGMYARGQKPLWVPPGVAGGIDDEFDSTTLDPAWLFRDLTTGPTNRTPAAVSPIAPWTALTGATTPPNYAVHTNGRKSHLLVQTTNTANAAYMVYKPFSYTAGHFYYCRLGDIQRIVGQNALSLGMGIWADSGGVPDQSSRLMIYWNNGGLRNTNGGTTTGWLSTDALGYTEYLGLYNSAGVLGSTARWWAEGFSDNGHRFVANTNGGDPNSFTPAYIGFFMSSAGVPDIAAIDFIREQVGHPLFSQI